MAFAGVLADADVNAAIDACKGKVSFQITHLKRCGVLNSSCICEIGFRQILQRSLEQNYVLYKIM